MLSHASSHYSNFPLFILIMIPNDTAETVTHDANIGAYPKYLITTAYTAPEIPAPRYVAKSMMPLTDAELPVFAYLSG